MISKKTEELTNFIKGELEDINDLFIVKNSQYSTSINPLSNFATGAMLQYGSAGYEDMYEVAKCYLNKHIAFLYDHGIAPKTEESLRDMVVYGLLMQYMVKKYYETGIVGMYKEEQD